MEVEEQANDTSKQKPKGRWARKFFLRLGLGFLSLAVLFQVAFLVYSDEMFGRLLKEVVFQGSDEVYSIQYEDVKFNVFRNEIAFTELRLVPDTVRFKQIQKEPGRSNRLIKINCPNLSVKGPSLFKLYFDKILEVDEFTINKPLVDVKVYGDFREGSGGMRNFHEAFTEYLNILRIDNCALDSAQLRFTKVDEKGRELFQFNDISLSVGQFKLDNSTTDGDSLLSLGDLKLHLGNNDIKVDTLNQIAFNSLDIDIKDSTIMADSFVFRPMEKNLALNQNTLNFKNLELLGVDFWELYSTKNAKARLLAAREGAIDMSRAFVPDSIEAWTKISNLFDTVSIERIDVVESQLHVQKLFGPRQNDITVPIHQGSLHSFLLDSQGFMRNKLNLYSKNVDLLLDPFSLTSKDGKQRIDINSLSLSTLNRELLLFDIGVASLDPKSTKAKVDGKLKSLQVFGVDPMVVLQKNRLIARAALLEKPDFSVAKGSSGQAFNSDVLNDLVKKQFRYVNVSSVQVENGNLELKSRKGYRQTLVQSANLFSSGFKTYSGKVPAGKHLLSDAVNAEFGLISSLLSDGLHEVKAFGTKVFTEKGGLYLDRLRIRLRESVPDSIAAINNIVREGNFVNMSIEGFNVDALLENQALEIKNITSKGENVLNMELNDQRKRKKPLWKLEIAEMNIDSIDTRITTKGDDELLMQINNAELQVCDLKWDSTYGSGLFDVYSLLVDGNEVIASSMNSEHRLVADQVKINTAYGLAQLNEVDIRPLNDKFSGKTATWFHSNQFRFNGLNLPQFLKTRAFTADNFYCLNPVITHHQVASENKNEGRAQNFLRDPFSVVSKYTGNISVQNVRVHQGKFKMYQYQEEKQVEYGVEGVTLFMKDFLIDSFTTHSDTNVLFAKESEIGLTSFERRANDTSMILSLGGLKAYPNKRELILEGIEVRNRKPATSLKHVLLTSKIAKLTGLSYNDLMINSRVRCDTVRFIGSSLTLGSDEKNTDKTEFFKKELPKALTRDYTSIRADKLYFDDAEVKLRYRDKETREIKTEKIPGWDIECTYFNLNRNYQRLSFLYSQYIKAYLRGYERELDDNLNYLYLDEGVFEPHAKKITLRNFSLTPRYEKMLYGRTYGKQIDRIQVDNPETTIRGFDFEKWLYTGVYHMRLITSKNTNISAFRDKTLEEERGLYKEMPQETLRNLPFELYIESVELDNWTISYEEQLGIDKAPGFIQFKDFDATFDTIHNLDTANSVDIVVKTTLMDDGRVNAELHIPNNHPEDEFRFNGTIDDMDMREINPLLENLVGIRIVSGQTDKVIFDGKADRFIAEGEVRMLYSDLVVKYIGDDADDSGGSWIWDPLKKRLTSRLIELVVRKGNERFSKPGRIYFERNREKSIFSYGAKALLSGIKNSIARRILGGGGKKKSRNSNNVDDDSQRVPPDPEITGDNE